MRQSLDEWAATPAPRKDILTRLDREASKMSGCDKELLFSFMDESVLNMRDNRAYLYPAGERPPALSTLRRVFLME